MASDGVVGIWSISTLGIGIFSGVSVLVDDVVGVPCSHSFTWFCIQRAGWLAHCVGSIAFESVNNELTMTATRGCLMLLPERAA